MNRTDSFVLFMTFFLLLRMTNSGKKKMRPLHDVDKKILDRSK